MYKYKKENLKKSIGFERSKSCEYLVNKRYDRNSFDSWLTKECKWLSKRELKVSRMRMQNQIEDETQIMSKTYAVPKICEKSRDLANFREISDLTLYDRLYLEMYNKQGRQRMRYNKSLPSFQPKTNNKRCASKTILRYPSHKNEIVAKEEETTYNYEKTVRITRLSTSPKKFHKVPTKDHFVMSLDDNIKHEFTPFMGKVESLYKLNVRDGSSCKDSVNTIYYKKQNSNIIKSVILK
jgi:hypothetical protein